MRHRHLIPSIVMALLLAASSGASQELRGQAFELTTATIADINAAFDSGKLTAEKLIELSLARIAAFDDAGPHLNAVLTLNRNALAEARALDAERATSGPRSPLHGIPILLKDNFDTHDLPTTGGSFVLAGSLPPDDAFLVRKLRDAGAVILAKTNMSEFASGDPLSSFGGVTRNPHDLERSPSGSSIGTGVGIAAAYAPLGLGTDTGGSVRAPASANGIVGLRPTYGLLSRDGIIPLGLSFDMAGPMARNVYDVAVSLGILAGVDPADDATARAAGRVESDYTSYLDVSALAGARIGVARQFLGQDGDVDWVVETSVEALRAAGATIVDVEFPEWLLLSRVDLYWTVRIPEFKPHMGAYLATLDDAYPKTVEELYRRSTMLRSPSPEGYIPNASRWHLLKTEAEQDTSNDYDYRAVRDHGLPLIRDIVAGLFEANRLDAIVYPTSPTRPPRLDADPPPELVGGSASTATLGITPTNIASLAGFPDLAVPAGFTSSGLPVTLSFLGPAFSDGRMLALGYAFEQRTAARRLPRTTPPLPGETLRH
jgi:amidase